MVRAALIGACAVLALAACRRNEPAAPQRPGKVTTTVIPEDVRDNRAVVIRPDVPNVLDKSALGAKLAADGTVAEEATIFTQAETPSLTIWLKESPPGVVTAVKWFGKGDEILEQQQRPMNGSKVSTFALKKKLAPGTYRVEGYWGGNVVADKTFDVVKK